MKLSVRAGLSGVAAAAVAVGAAEVVAVLTGPLSAPLIAVGGVVVDNVPAAVKDFGVRVFGVHDKTALIVGTSILLAAYAYGVGVAALRSWRLAVGGIGLFALVGVLAALTRHDAGVFAWLPTVAGAALAVWTLRLLLEQAGVLPAEAAPARTPAEEQAAWAGVLGTRAGTGRSATTGNIPQRADGPDHDGASTARPGAGQDPYGKGRRGFLQGLGIAAGVAVVSGLAGRWLTSRQAVTAARSEVVLPKPRQTAPPVPAGVQVPGVTPYISPNKDFYRIDTALIPPRVDPTTWQLRIHGMVRNPITITWEQLLQRPMIERYVTLACVSNEVGGDLIGNALWLGTPIRELLEEAGPLPGADQVIQRSVDGWTCGSPTSALMDGRDALLAVGMNSEPLPVNHGFPVRMVVPGLYGYVSACKWITEIELSRFSDFDAYWVPRGWAAQAPIKTESRIDTPRDGGKRPAGTVVVGGVAWAQHRGITKVEVQVDDGEWAEASLAATVSSDTWREWSWSWPATAGEHSLRVRATDGQGVTQTSTPAPPAPDGASGWHQIRVGIEG
ncbi:molybdopterin-dependent oxidoreductase [Paractinoplanes lichenicola]|uniref:Molybdopterin-dependent oxidoreductase n=1 Tax=Paractinoplanes lichenicola TaxID=2802976 RepID=A0ABS1VQI3_9ACTN|nr:molybdopterin-dependent oxidoreductase [Actinoplanes lichenicola]MBL7256988.1 molybdopterin-dependent oxidoreductase [Actinoplanes lichenicola]